MLEVSARSTTQIENGKGVIALHRTQERGMVLAHVVIPGAVPVIFGRPVIMPDGYFRNAPQVCFYRALWTACQDFPLSSPWAPLSSRTVALGTRAAEEFGHRRAGPAAALSGGDALGVEMIGDGLGRSHPRRFGGLNFADEVPHERLDLLSPLRHSEYPSV